LVFRRGSIHAAGFAERQTRGEAFTDWRLAGVTRPQVALREPQAD